MVLNVNPPPSRALNKSDSGARPTMKIQSDGLELGLIIECMFLTWLSVIGSLSFGRVNLLKPLLSRAL